MDLFSLVFEFILCFSEPTFITSFDVDDYVLFFIKEKSLEQVAEGQDVNYARVIRVCKVGFFFIYILKNGAL